MERVAVEALGREEAKEVLEGAFKGVKIGDQEEGDLVVAGSIEVVASEEGMGLEGAEEGTLVEVLEGGVTLEVPGVVGSVEEVMGDIDLKNVFLHKFRVYKTRMNFSFITCYDASCHCGGMK